MFLFTQRFGQNFMEGVTWTWEQTHSFTNPKVGKAFVFSSNVRSCWSIWGGMLIPQTQYTSKFWQKKPSTQSKDLLFRKDTVIKIISIFTTLSGLSYLPGGISSIPSKIPAPRNMACSSWSTCPHWPLFSQHPTAPWKMTLLVCTCENIQSFSCFQRQLLVVGFRVFK